MKLNPETGKRDRPGFSKDYGVDTNNLNGLLPWEWVNEKLSKSRNYWIVSTRKNGNPHAAPVWGIYYEAILYFATGEKSQKAVNIVHNPAVVVHLESGDDTVILEGSAIPVKDKVLLENLSTVYGQKYQSYQPPPDFGAGTVVYAVEPKIVLAWKENDFINTPTRWVFE